MTTVLKVNNTFQKMWKRERGSYFAGLVNMGEVKHEGIGADSIHLFACLSSDIS